MQYMSLFDRCPIPAILSLPDDGRIVDVNKAFQRLSGWRPEDIAGRTSIELGFWDSADHRVNFMRELKAQGHLPSVRLSIPCRDGSAFSRTLFASLFLREEKPHIFCCVVDLHEQQALEHGSSAIPILQAGGTQKRILDETRRFCELCDSMMDGYSRLDKNNRFLSCNRAFCAMIGYTEEELLHLTCRDITPAHWHALDERIEREELAVRGFSRVYEKEYLKKDGSILPVELQLYLHRNEKGEPDGLWRIVRDLSERKKHQANLDFLTCYDPLTRLPNRALFMDRLRHAFRRMQRSQGRLALLFVDIDHFKSISNTLGHLNSSTLLQTVAHGMKNLLRAGDTLARIGIDEFILLLEDAATQANAASVASKIRDLFAAPIHIHDEEIYLTASIGISQFPEDSDDPETLLKYANLAMLKAKAQGRNTFQRYESTLGADVFARTQLEKALRGAVQRQEFVVYYQPQIDLATGCLAGVEALVRWQHPKLGLVMPNRFIPVAEEMGIISDIGAWVLQEACRQMKAWQEQGMDAGRMAVNLSVQQLERADLVSLVAQQLQLHHLDPGALELEVTESMLMRQPERALATLNELNQLGVYLAVDDFGTGYSSLSYLKHMPVHRLKIDYSFVCNIGQNPHDEAIARAVIALSSSLGLETVAEGVEREEQEDFLRREGCQIAQGYRYARPIPAAEIAEKYGGGGGAK
jgi:diguanylate cyclase (GGDEF)-like protein/PAS domain S-box-containing protein